MSEKTLTFNNIKLNKKEFQKSKEPIQLLSVTVDHIVVNCKLKLLNRCVLFYLKWMGI